MREDESTTLKCFSYLNSLILDRRNYFKYIIKSMYTVKSGICVLSPDMFIGMRNKQEACEYTPLHDCTLKVEKSTF